MGDALFEADLPTPGRGLRRTLVNGQFVCGLSAASGMEHRI